MKNLTRHFLIFGSFFFLQDKINASDKTAGQCLPGISWIEAATYDAAIEKQIKAMETDEAEVARYLPGEQTKAMEVEEMEAEEVEKLALHLLCSEDIDVIVSTHQKNKPFFHQNIESSLPGSKKKQKEKKPHIHVLHPAFTPLNKLHIVIEN